MMTNTDYDDIDGDDEGQEGTDVETELFGAKEVRWYQVAARNGVEMALESKPNARILLVQPTGSGKTVSSGLIFSSQRVRKALNVPADRKLRLLFIAHKHRLLTQAEEAYASAENVEFIPQSAFSPLSPDLLAAGWDVTCIDEAHHEAMTTIQYHLDQLGNKPIIGLTATPDRADGCLIKFDIIIDPISREQAVEEGWLAPTRIHTFLDVPTIDKTEMLTNLLNDYAHQMGQTMIFVKTKREIVNVVEVLVNLGYDAEGILSQSERELNILLDQFSEGAVQFIVNCNKINEGVDVKGCTDVLLGRQFGSYAQLNQVIGRAARPDSPCNVWELINPLSARNLDTTVVVGTPEFHRLVGKEGGQWVERQFNYVQHRTNKQLGVATGVRASHR